MKDAVAAVERRIIQLVPQDLLDPIYVPTKLTEIRAYVRWEEAGLDANHPGSTPDGGKRLHLHVTLYGRNTS